MGKKIYIVAEKNKAAKVSDERVAEVAVDALSRLPLIGDVHASFGLFGRLRRYAKGDN